MTFLPYATSAAVTFCYPHGDDLLVVACAVSGVCPRLPARHEGQVVRSGAAGELSSSLLQQLPILTPVSCVVFHAQSTSAVISGQSCVGKTHTKARKQFFISTLPP